MILTNDNFASIETAGGGNCYQNLEGDRLHFASQRWGILTILVGVLLTAPAYPTFAILWVNMVSSVVLTVPLALEPSSKDVMRSSPRNPNQSLLSVAY